MDSIYPVVSGAVAFEKRLDIIANNLANVNTTGFKKSFAVFSGVTNAGEPDNPIAFGTFDQVLTDFSAGAVRQTGSPLDIAIQGDGFFAIQTPDGVRYTRNGSFSLNDQGQMVTANGYPVLGAGGPVSLPQGQVTIDADGHIFVTGTEVNAQPAEADILQVSTPTNRAAMSPVGNSLYEAGSDAGITTGDGRFVQGALEGSNVNPVEEMVSMIQVMRLYEAAQKSIQTADEAASKASSDVGKLS